MNRPAKFNKKAFFSFLTVFIWLILIITGIVLYFSPPGRIAHWVEWRFLGLTKENWQAIHTLFSFTFILVGAFHLYFNWVVFWNYLKSKVQTGIKMQRELIFSSAMILTMFLLIILKVPPFQTVMDIGEDLSNSWSNPQTEPPIPHAELLTLQEFAQQTQQDFQLLLCQLKKAGIQQVDSVITLKEMAEKNDLTPQELLEKVTNSAGKQDSYYPGYGRKTISEISISLNLDENLVMDRLHKNNIRFEKTEILKDIADRYDLKPIDLVNIITGEREEKMEDPS